MTLTAQNPYTFGALCSESAFIAAPKVHNLTPAKSKAPPASPPAIVLWVLVCAYVNLAGWVLSALHQLNMLGYGIAAGLGLAGMLVLRRDIFQARQPHCHWRRYRRRFTRAFPLAFLILGGMAVLGGILYGPSNYDALAYRIPRMLHWLAEGRWHWIHTEFNRLNSRACGIEWVSTPLLILTRTDRFLFLVNAFCLSLMPGLVFALFTRLGVRPRVAWHWMWIVPTAYCFLLQAGSVGNDLFGAVFPIAALVFALRVRMSGRPFDAWLSILSAAMTTASKSSNLPLLLPWAVALLPSIKFVLRRPFATSVVCAVALFASFAPTAVLNRKYCGDWTGLSAEQARIGAGPIWLHLGANAVLLTIQNFVPPVFPFANAWNNTMRAVVPSWLNKRMEAAFEPGGAHFMLGEMEIEEQAGLGFGVSMLLLVSFVAGRVMKRLRDQNFEDNGLENKFQTIVLLSAVTAFLVFVSRLGLTTIARLITPYYCLLLPLLLRGDAHTDLVKRLWWRRIALGVFIIAGGLLILSPARPLWPANAFLARIDANAQAHPLLVRAKTVYSVYSQRTDGFAPARRILPPGVKVLGFISFDDPEASLWRPLGSRRIEHVMKNDTADGLKSRGVEYVLINSYTFHFFWGRERQLESWLVEYNAELVRTIPLTLRASQGPVDWYLVRLK